MAKSESRTTQTQQRGTRKSARTAKKPEQDLELDSKKTEAIKELERLTREAVFGLFAEIEKYILTLDDSVAEHLRTIVANAQEAVERLGFILQEAEMANAEPLWHTVWGGDEEVDEGKIAPGFMNKLNGTEFTLDDLDAARVLVEMANSGKEKSVDGYRQEELDAAHALLGLARGERIVADENPADAAPGSLGSSDAPSTLQGLANASDTDDLDDINGADGAAGAHPKNALDDADDTIDDDEKTANTSNVRAEPYILPNGKELKLIPVTPNFRPQNIPADTDAGPSYTKIRDNEIAKQAQSRGYKKSEKEAKALAKPDGPEPYDNYMAKRKSVPDAFEDDNYPFHKFRAHDTGSALGGDLSMGPEDVRRKREEEGKLPSGKKKKSNRAKRQKLS
ncbi:hypothetical protein N7G274_007107 [Stereocaulon virgatum]|uniref:Uncharacterized protein n=1 Tax=Stereocaulon virgatum TaxID=373712 RepID=A0ABR4A610_9LECA